MGQTKTIVGFIAGLSVGVIAGILLAPDSGSETRKKLKQMSAGLLDSVKDTFTGIADNVQNTLEDQALQNNGGAAPSLHADA